MRMAIHHRIGKKVWAELKELGCHIHEKLFLLGNLFPDLIQSYIWRRHEYPHSREYVRKKLISLEKKPLFFSFHLGVLTHYICDYFCYPHSSGYNKGLIQHILYEIRQKVPEKLYNTNLNINAFTIEELDKLVNWYENVRASFNDDEPDFHIAATVASNFLRTLEYAPA
ncbi:MAG: zinc dependent phospholipase C family protein [Treponema sp.]|nr:zinc dependent phospholipase C family protein [Treponema sp.]